MKNASSALINFLDSCSGYARADFYTITLNGGGILRYCSAVGAVKANGFTFGAVGGIAPLVQDAGVKSARGVQVSEVDITFYADERHLVNGVQFLDFVENLGLDGALMQIERGFAADWRSMRLSGPVGTYMRFSGHFAEAKELGQTQVIVTASSPLDLFTNNTPTDCFQSSCLNTVGDSKCTINMSSYAASGVVASSPAPTANTFGSNLTPTTNDYALGKVVFTSGANSGIASTIKSQDSSGNFTLVVPLPAAPASGDTFTAYPGCDLSMSRCTSRFNNLIHFRGQPFIPDPSTGLPS